MQPPILEQVRTSLLDRRANLAQWLSRAPAPDRSLRLGPIAEEAVSEHLVHLEGFIHQAEVGQMGVCTVCHEYVDTRRLVADYTARVCLDHLSPDEASALERELELASTVQQGLLPGEAPAIPGLDLAAFTRPAQIIGGDYFDFFAFQGGDHGWAIGDAAGHGVSASLTMAGLQALCRAVIPASTGPAAAAGEIQRLFIRNSRFATFVSLFLAAFRSSSRRLTYCNAGHNPPLLVRADGVVHWLQPTGPAVGLVEEAAYSETTVDLHSGDLLVMYTDGVVEAADSEGRPFDPERLVAAVRDAGGAPAGSVLRRVTQSLETFLAGRDLADDITLVVARAE